MVNFQCWCNPCPLHLETFSPKTSKSLMTVRKYIFLAGVVMYIYNSNTQETKAGGL
jgi:hypothetical protein